MILVDSSAWIEWDRASGSVTDRRLARLIRSRADLACSEPVLMEVLAGARDEEAAERLRRLLTSFSWLPVDPAADFEGAARIYRACRADGITLRGLQDCLIAAVALRHDAALLTADADFARIADVMPLRLAAD